MKHVGLYKIIIFYLLLFGSARYIYLKDIKVLIFGLIIAAVVILFIIYEKLQSIKKNYLKKNGEMIEGKIDKVVKSDGIHYFELYVTYEKNGVSKQLKSEILEYDPNFLIKSYDIKTIPVYISKKNNNFTVIDTDYFASYMKKFLEDNKYNNYEENNDSNIFVFELIQKLVYILIIGCLLFIHGLNGFILHSILFIILIITYLCSYSGISLKKLGTKVMGYVESVECQTDVFNNTVASNFINLETRSIYYIITVCYVFNNKIYVKNSKKIYSDLSQFSKSFIPVYIYPEKPNISYIDLTKL